MQLGQTLKLVLKGDNPVVDRRAITFAGDKKGKKDEKKDDEKKDEPKADAPKENETPLENAEPRPEDVAPAPLRSSRSRAGAGASWPVSRRRAARRRWRRWRSARRSRCGGGRAEPLEHGPGARSERRERGGSAAPGGAAPP